jgi:hypothetical protein
MFNLVLLPSDFKGSFVCVRAAARCDWQCNRLSTTGLQTNRGLSDLSEN